MNATDNPNVDESPFIMVEKGGCSYVSKVLNIEDARGHAAIIIDDRNGGDVEEKNMPDDGRGNEVSIPSVLISYEDGEKLKKFYTDNKNNKTVLQNIKLEINFEMENKDNTVNYDIWYTPDMEKVYEILTELYAYHNVLYKYANISVHLVTYSDFDYKDSDTNIVKDCLGSGAYCLDGKKAGIEKEGGGVLLVKEAIRQQCILEINSGEKDSEGNDLTYATYFKYMNYFFENCYSIADFSEDCSYSAAKHAGIDADEFEDCYQNSFKDKNKRGDYELTSKNKILENNQDLMSELYINKLPTITINGRVYYGNWKAEYVFDALCASLIKKPKECYEYGTFEEESSMSSLTITAVILIVLFVNIAIFLICRVFIRRRIQERLNSSDINSKIDTVVSSYLAMREVKH